MLNQEFLPTTTQLLESFGYEATYFHGIADEHIVFQHPLGFPFPAVHFHRDKDVSLQDVLYHIVFAATKQGIQLERNRQADRLALKEETYKVTFAISNENENESETEEVHQGSNGVHEHAC